MLAALSCALAARRSEGRRRLAWSLLAGSAFMWGIGATITAFSDVVLGGPQPGPTIPAGRYGAPYPVAVPFPFSLPTAPLSTPHRLATLIPVRPMPCAHAFSRLSVAWHTGT